MKKRIAILVCLFAISFPVVPIWGHDYKNNIGKELKIGTEIATNINQLLSCIEFQNIETKIGYLNNSTNIRVEPNLESYVVEVKPFNTEIEYYDYDENWVCIEQDENVFYVYKSLISESPTDYLSYNTPYNKIKSYMSYKSITSKSSDQYKMQQIAYTGNYGIRQVNGRYCIAVGSAYTTKIGQYIDLVLEDGTIIPCILADCKADIHTDSNNICTSDGSLAEFIVDTKALSKTVRYTGDISTACEDWESMITQVIVYDKKEEF